VEDEDTNLVACAVNAKVWENMHLVACAIDAKVDVEAHAKVGAGEHAKEDDK
jgi:hypothetical protein